MKRIWCIPLMVFCCGALLCGCSADKTETITNRNIPVQDITEFYYTYENINFNAFYQRYHFYVDGERYMFHHETREKPNGYGWTTEEDITKSGTFELSPEHAEGRNDKCQNGIYCVRFLGAVDVPVLEE